MTQTLFLSKITIPRLQPNLVPRPQLIEKLDEGLKLGRKMSLISAPAGFGKSTLAAVWLSHQRSAKPTEAGIRKTVWLSLDEDDDNLESFFQYVCAALGPFIAGASATLGLLHSTQSASPKGLATNLISDVSKEPQPFIFVLEDYHTIVDPSIHEALNYLIEHLPAHFHLVITSRVDPLLSLPRLRASGQLTEIRTDDLRLSVDEAAEFLKQTMSVSLNRQEIKTLEQRTEGWIAGLQMAALSLQGLTKQEKITEFIEEFAGTHRYIFDYLTDEVLEQRPPGTRIFLLRTSILDRFCASLCDAVINEVSMAPEDGPAADKSEALPETGLSSQDILEQLDQSNLFLIPLDSKRKWYRYHHLFAELLRQRLNRFSPDLVPTLYQRASEWYENQGEVRRAMHFALAGKDHPRAAVLLDIIALRLINRAEIRELLSWIGRIPNKGGQSLPRLDLAHAWALMFSYQYHLVEGMLAQSEAHLTQPDKLPVDLPQAQLAASTKTIKAYMAARNGQLQDSLTLSKRALSILDEASERPVPDLRGPIALNMGITYQALDDIDLAEKNYKEALRINKEESRGFATIATYGNLMRLHSAKGNLHQVYVLGLEGSAFSDEYSHQVGYTLPAEAEIRRELARLYYEWGDLPAAKKQIDRGLELTSWSSPTVALEILHVGFFYYLAQGDLAKAMSHHEECARLSTREGLINQQQEEVRSAERTILFFLLGDDDPDLLSESRRWAAASSLKAGDSIPLKAEKTYLIYARLLLVDNLPDESLEVARQLCKAAVKARRYGDLVRYQLMVVQALRVAKQEEEALETLKETVMSAEHGGYVRSFIDQSPTLLPLLRKLTIGERKKDDRSTDIQSYLSTLIQTIADGRRPLSSSRSQQLQEPISERELEVLRLLATHLTGPEIAQQLFISINTYKSHTRNIYGKLDVNSRAEAVARAQKLGLL